MTISNFLGKDPVSTCERYDRKRKEEISVPRPACIELYNKFMGGVDKADMLLSLYRTKHRSKKWYHHIAFHLISLAVVNAFLLYREVGGDGSLVDFLIDICRCLLVSDSQGSGESSNDEIPKHSRERSLRANQVPTNVCYDKHNHWPLQCDKPQRCKWDGCGRRTRFICSKCQMYLCFGIDTYFNALELVTSLLHDGAR